MAQEIKMRIHHIAISAANLERSIQFYKENLGFEELSRFTKSGWDGNAAIMRLDTVKLEIFSFASEKNKKDDLSNLKVTGFKHIGIQVDDVKSKFKELKKKELDIDTPVKGTTCAWFCFLRDPDGIPIELYEANK